MAQRQPIANRRPKRASVDNFSGHKRRRMPKACVTKPMTIHTLMANLADSPALPHSTPRQRKSAHPIAQPNTRSSNPWMPNCQRVRGGSLEGALESI